MNASYRVQYNFKFQNSFAIMVRMKHHRKHSIQIFIIVLVVLIAILAVYTYAQGSRSTIVTPLDVVSLPSVSDAPYTSSTPTQLSVCTSETIFSEAGDERWCDELPLISRMRLFQIDLTHEKILFFQYGILQKVFPIAYQAPYGKWFQTPTGFFEIGVKREKFMSSIFPVWMEHAVQVYEDFFIHGIPYHSDGTKVTSQFSGGCIRLEDTVAADFFTTTQKGDVIVSYLSLSDAQVQEGFFSPVDTSSFWIRQRFNSPLKTDWSWYEDKQYNYIQHAGVDFASRETAQDLSVHAIASGTVEAIISNGVDDGGLGNTIIMSHLIEGKKKYVLYGHLASIVSTQIGAPIKGGDVLGVAGNTGYGCAYWRVGEDGCDKTGDADVHLHLEIKDKPILASPLSDTCVLPSGKKTQCIGYTSTNPTSFGYSDPLPIIFSSGVLPHSSVTGSSTP
ncbi:MAG: peptidoglycan DD-metalloendopeptidase family protein [Candidatus Paceibacterota bacterium]